MPPYFWAPAIIVAAVLYLLYRSGLMVTKSLAAILFVLRPGRDRDRVRLDTCTGWVRHVGRFQEKRTYLFDFEARLSKGSAEVFLLDRNKQPVLRLNRQSARGTIQLEEGGRYYLRWEFQNATGQCELHWKEIETKGR